MRTATTRRVAPSYDPIAPFYDAWSVSVTEDVEFYVEEALAAGGPVVELAVGTGRIAVPIAKAGIPVIGIDLSVGMLERARTYARAEGVEPLLDLRVGDMREPPVDERASLVTIPFRSVLHLDSDAERLRALKAAASLLAPGGRLVFDVFAPSAEDVEETHGRWLEREPGIFERADWDVAGQTLELSVRSGEGSASFSLHWLDAQGWRSLLREAGLKVCALYGWFDRSPYEDDEDMIWVCEAARAAS
ncbi:MAG: class I SAM-dependent methyltransferase [Thermoleophilia bacterium]|nr:class I SAM-dependent methyltransferase [Thermoleophilia bacterium]